MTILVDAPSPYSGFETSSRIPFASGGTLGAAATVSSAEVEFIGSTGVISSDHRNRDGWLRRSIAELNKWLSEDDNWDSYGARRISPKVAARVARLLAKLAQRGIPEPFITGTSGGGIALQWETERYDLQFSFEDLEEDGASYQNKETGELIEGELGKVLRVLKV